MSIIKTLEMLGQDPALDYTTLTQAQKNEIAALKKQADFINANMIIDEPDSPDDEPQPEPEKNPQ